MRDKEHEGLYWFGPLRKVKAYVQFEVILIRVTIARELNSYARLSMRLFSPSNRCRVVPLYR